MSSQQHRNISYDTRVWLLLITLLLSLSFTTFFLKQDLFANNVTLKVDNAKPIYLFEPPYLRSGFEALGIDYVDYRKMVDNFVHSSTMMGLQVTQTAKLDVVDKNAILVLLDTLALSQTDKAKIAQFVKEGGSLLFNSSAGFRDQFSEYKGDAFVHSLTGLSLSPEYGYLQFPNGLMATPKILSPLTKALSNGPLLEIVLYDPLPLFIMPEDRSADLYMTNHSQVAFPKINGKPVPRTSSGLAWSGVYGKGKWVYTSLPLYSLYESVESKKELLQLYHGMVEYLTHDVIIRSYPYLDAQSVSFVSEDTEYRYESAGQFSDLSLAYKVPTTIFCVAALAEENKELMSEVAKNPYLEVGSHSYTHTAIVGTPEANYQHETRDAKTVLESITGKKVEGFRPPREELDALLISNLETAGYRYTLTNNEGILYPYFRDHIMIIPRHGTDDYSYLVNLDWTPNEIGENMVRESQFYEELNAIYTMSTHTHLMNFSTNISILEHYFKYLQNNTGMRSMNGEMIYARITAMQKITISAKSDLEAVTIKVTNQNDTIIKDYTFRLYSMQHAVKTVTADQNATVLQMHKVQKGIYDVTVAELQPSSQLVLHAQYQP